MQMMPHLFEYNRTSIQLTYQSFKGILDDMQSKSLGTYRRDARVSIPIHRRPDINYLAEQSAKLQREPISTHTSSELPHVIITVTLFNPEKQQDRNEEVEILSIQTIGDLIAHVGCHTQSMMMDAEHQPEKVCFIGNKVYTNTSDISAKERLYRSLYAEYDTSKITNAEPLTTKFNEIDIVFGQPHLLSHNGQCRHVFMFKNARCVQLANKESESIFPQTTFRGRINRIKCQMCTIYPAE
ncbi:snRNA-activating protein of 50kDa MW C terminal-domain-containing protein [Syncephalis plumigaleata]|nr:snRNA-activating protein of 50kDa MW C terminal-domain-containing protein [Syncephalis plumigaleata]